MARNGHKPYYAALTQNLLASYSAAMQPGAAKLRLREARIRLEDIRAFRMDAVFASTFQRAFWLDLDFVRKSVKARLNGKHKKLSRDQRALERELKALSDEFRHSS